jgi:hypothetical protein
MLSCCGNALMVEDGTKPSYKHSNILKMDNSYVKGFLACSRCAIVSIVAHAIVIAGLGEGSYQLSC